MKSQDSNRLDKRLQVDVDPMMAVRAMKYATIEDFNKAVESKASKAFLTSLYKQATFDLAEYNKVLGLHPENGLRKLDIGWKE